MPPGGYLIKLSIDQTEKLKTDFTRQLEEEDFVAQVEVESQWPAGFGRATVVNFPVE